MMRRFTQAALLLCVSPCSRRRIQATARSTVSSVTYSETEYGDIADAYDSDLVMYLAGNPFRVLQELIKDFQTKHPEIITV